MYFMKKKNRLVYGSLIGLSSANFLVLSSIKNNTNLNINVLDNKSKTINSNLKSEISNAYSRFLKNVDELHKQFAAEYKHSFNDTIWANINTFHPFCDVASTDIFNIDSKRHGVHDGLDNEWNRFCYQFKPVVLSSSHEQDWNFNPVEPSSREKINADYIFNLLTLFKCDTNMNVSYNAKNTHEPDELVDGLNGAVWWNCEDEKPRFEFFDKRHSSFFGTLGNNGLKYLFKATKNNHNHFSDVTYSYANITNESQLSKRERNHWYYEHSANKDTDTIARSNWAKNDLFNYLNGHSYYLLPYSQSLFTAKDWGTYDKWQVGNHWFYGLIGNPLNQKFKTYDLANLFEMTDFGYDNEKKRIYTQIGINEKYIAAAEGEYLNLQLLGDSGWWNTCKTSDGFGGYNRENWISSKDIDFNNIGNRISRDRLFSLIDSYINANGMNRLITYDNYEKISEWVKDYVHNNHSVPENDIFTNAIKTDELKNNGWTTIANNYAFSGESEIYENLILTLPLMNFKLSQQFADTNEITKNSKWQNWMSNETDTSISFDQIKNGYKVYLNTSGIEKASFKTQVLVNASESEGIKVENWQIPIDQNVCLPIDNTNAKFLFNDSIKELKDPVSGSKDNYCTFDKNTYKHIINVYDEVNIDEVEVNSEYKSKSVGEVLGILKNKYQNDYNSWAKELITRKQEEHLNCFGVKSLDGTIDWNIKNQNIKFQSYPNSGSIVFNLLNTDTNQIIDNVVLSGFKIDPTEDLIKWNDETEVKVVTNNVSKKYKFILARVIPDISIKIEPDEEDKFTLKELSSKNGSYEFSIIGGTKLGLGTGTIKVIQNETGSIIDKVHFKVNVIGIPDHITISDEIQNIEGHQSTSGRTNKEFKSTVDEGYAGDVNWSLESIEDSVLPKWLSIDKETSIISWTKACCAGTYKFKVKCSSKYNEQVSCLSDEVTLSIDNYTPPDPSKQIQMWAIIGGCSGLAAVLLIGFSIFVIRRRKR